ncbi:MAG TPA: hypothetical protein VHI54_05450, partial [Actinomycetota bacterium]|nr:hypothetical protein [Actinomycetota bacterium]
MKYAKDLAIDLSPSNGRGRTATRASAWHSELVKAPSTGIQSLDGLIDGLRYGDNVVWEIDGPDQTPFMAAFLRASRGTPLVYVSLHVSPQAILDRFAAEWDPNNFLLIDCFTDGLARGDPAVS